MTIVDASAVIDFLDGTEPMHSAVRTTIAKGEFATNVIVRYEVLSGETTDSAYLKARRLLDAIPCRVLDIAAHERAIAIGRTLERRGCRIGAPDTLIAGMAIVHGDLILTKNKKHFERVEGLILDPAST